MKLNTINNLNNIAYSSVRFGQKFNPGRGSIGRQSFNYARANYNRSSLNKNDTLNTIRQCLNDIKCEYIRLDTLYKCALAAGVISTLVCFLAFNPIGGVICGGLTLYDNYKRHENDEKYEEAKRELEALEREALERE